MAATPAGSFIDNFVTMADDFGAWLAAPLQIDNFVTFADDAGASAATVPKAPAEIAQAAGSAVGGLVEDAKAAATSTAWQLAAWGGVALVAYVAIQRLERR